MARQPAARAACRSVRWSPTSTLRARSRSRRSAARRSIPGWGFAAVAARLRVVRAVQHRVDAPAPSAQGVHHLAVNLLQRVRREAPVGDSGLFVTTTTG